MYPDSASDIILLICPLQDISASEQRHGGGCLIDTEPAVLIGTKLMSWGVKLFFIIIQNLAAGIHWKC